MRRLLVIAVALGVLTAHRALGPTPLPLAAEAAWTRAAAAGELGPIAQGASAVLGVGGHALQGVLFALLAAVCAAWGSGPVQEPRPLGRGGSPATPPSESGRVALSALLGASAALGVPSLWIDARGVGPTVLAAVLLVGCAVAGGARRWGAALGLGACAVGLAPPGGLLALGHAGELGVAAYLPGLRGVGVAALRESGPAAGLPWPHVGVLVVLLLREPRRGLAGTLGVGAAWILCGWAATPLLAASALASGGTVLEPRWTRRRREGGTGAGLVSALVALAALLQGAATVRAVRGAPPSRAVACAGGAPADAFAPWPRAAALPCPPALDLAPLRGWLGDVRAGVALVAPELPAGALDGRLGRATWVPAWDRAATHTVELRPDDAPMTGWRALLPPPDAILRAAPGWTLRAWARALPPESALARVDATAHHPSRQSLRTWRVDREVEVLAPASSATVLRVPTGWEVVYVRDQALWRAVSADGWSWGSPEPLGIEAVDPAFVRLEAGWRLYAVVPAARGGDPAHGRTTVRAWDTPDLRVYTPRAETVLAGEGLLDPSVARRPDGTWEMWLTEGGRRVRRATSSDGLRFALDVSGRASVLANATVPEVAPDGAWMVVQRPLVDRTALYLHRRGTDGAWSRGEPLEVCGTGASVAEARLYWTDSGAPCGPPWAWPNRAPPAPWSCPAGGGCVTGTPWNASAP
jgi:hypothetical protein